MKMALLLLLFMISIANAQDLDKAFSYNQSGLMAQKLRLALTVENIANSSTMEDKETGLPWQRRFAVLVPDKNGVKVASVEKSKNPFGKRFDPSDPAANADGYLAYPNINLPDEMFNLSYTEVIFEANATALKTTKSLYQGFIDMMK
jgi:flagellar basal-body rod protein FlgC